MRSVSRFVTMLVFLSLLPCARAEQPDGGLFRSGDRVVLIGNTLIEREQEYAGWELPLTLATGDKNLTFRNLGWSGDTVWAESRGIFDPPAEGYKRTLELVRELQPTVILVGYGTVEAFAGPSRLEAFLRQYEQLLSDLAATGARFAHLSPMLVEPESLPDQSPRRLRQIQEYQQHLTQYAEGVRGIAQKRGEPFVDFMEFQRKSPGKPLMQNGIHLTRDGYDGTGSYLAEQLTGRRIPADALQGGEMEELRQAIIEKNRFFFHRWRPQNVTYLFGFRKHEQGQNAVEIAQFDPFIAEGERAIQQRAVALARSLR